MKRQGLLRTPVAIVGIIALFGIGGLRGEDRPQHPNVLIITTDQQRVDAMSAMGNSWAKTPNMDAIAASGISFRRSYCPYPLCSPSRSSLHTSRMPHEIRVDRNSVRIAEGIPLSGQVFRAAGYETGYAGKWHMPDPYPRDGIAGFEVLNTTTRQGKLAHDVDEATMQSAIKFLERPREKPFLLVVSFINPHDICLLAGEKSPLAADVWKRYEPAADSKLPPLPENHARAVNEPAGTPNRAKHDGWDESQWRRYRYAYFRMLEDVDQQVGQVMDALRKSGQEEKTLVVFTSDHGEGLGCHLWTGKMMYFEEEAAVPLVISWKGVTPRGKIDTNHLVSALDVLPTICDYAKVSGPETMRGETLKPIIDDPTKPGHEFVVAEMTPGAGPRNFMVRTARYKYMVFPGTSRSEMLFDLDRDPGEMTNIAGQPSLAGEVQRHRELLAQWNKLTEEDKFTPQPAAKPARKAAKRQK